MLTTRNLTIMFTDIVGYTERAAACSRAGHVALLQEHDRLLYPLIRRHEGTLVKSLGDGLLVTFASATTALRCAMALQDALTEANRHRSDAEQLHIRVALAAGDVQLQNHDVFGEAVSIASRIETITPPDQIYFAASAYLAMNKAEIPAELVSSQKLKGIPVPVDVYRVVSQHEYGRYQPLEDIVAAAEPGWVARAARLHPAIWGIGAVLILAALSLPWLMPDAVTPPQVAVAPAAPASIAPTEPPPKPPEAEVQQIEQLLDAGEVEAANAALSEALSAQSSSAELLLAQGHLAFAESRRESGVDAYRKALEIDPTLADNPLLADNLVGALGWETKAARPLLEQYASPAMVAALAERTGQAGYWGRLHAAAILRAIGQGDRVQRLQAALLDLREGDDCDKRRAAIERLGALRDPRALPALQPLAHMPLLERFTNKDRCLVSAAQAAVAQIE